MFGLWDEGGVGCRYVFLIDNEYFMFYEGVNNKGIYGIGFVILLDGIYWERDLFC